MVTFRSANNNNNRRSQFRNNNNNRRTSFRGSNEGSKFSNNDNFRRNAPGRNNHNASKLIEKYNNLAREALSSGDKILSENYFQHADHFTRIQNEQESFKKAKFLTESSEAKSANGNAVPEKKDKKEELEKEVESKKEETEVKNTVA